MESLAVEIRHEHASVLDRQRNVLDRLEHAHAIIRLIAEQTECNYAWRHTATEARQQIAAMQTSLGNILASMAPDRLIERAG